MVLAWRGTARGNTTAQAYDLELCQRALSVITDGQGFSQVQGISGSKSGAPSRIFDASKPEAFEQALVHVGDYDRVQILINPCKEVPSGAATRTGDILRRRWLMLDIDAARPDTKVMATEAERLEAQRATDRVRMELGELGWPSPIVIDSGNGRQLLYRVDLPNDKYHRAVIAQFLKKLGARLGMPKTVLDPQPASATAACKLPGSTCRKGPCTDERPWRPVVFADLPPVRSLVGLDKLLAIAGVVKEPRPTPDPKPMENGHPGASQGPFRGKATNGDQAKHYAKVALERECNKLATTEKGQLNNQLRDSAFAMGRYVATGLLDEEEVVQRILQAGRDAGCDNPRKDEDTVRRSVKAGMEVPKGAPERPQPKSAAQQAEAEGSPLIVRASTVTPRAVEWLWPGRIPLGKLTTFAGVGGLGKTFVLLDIAARVSRGMEWPSAGGECAEPGQVLFVSGEDEADDTLVPRLIELGADLSKVCFLSTEVADRFTLSDIETLGKAADAVGEGLRFVAIDPPTCYLGGVDDHSNAELRALLSPLKSWAARRRVALVFNTHVNKGTGGKVDAMMRVMGSVAWVNAVRSAYMFARDPEDWDKRLFCGMKNNIGPEKKGLSYQIVVKGPLATIQWLGEVETTADQAINREPAKKRRLVASEWLAGFFADRLKVPSEEIWKAKDRETTLSTNAVKEAKEDMGIRAKREYDDDGEASWYWTWNPEEKIRWREHQQRKKERQGTPDEQGEEEVEV